MRLSKTGLMLALATPSPSIAANDVELGTANTAGWQRGLVTELNLGEGEIPAGVLYWMIWNEQGTLANNDFPQPSIGPRQAWKIISLRRWRRCGQDVPGGGGVRYLS